MYSQFFGNYLLQKNAVTTEQMVDALSRLEDTQITLDTLAIHKGLMAANEIDAVCLEQEKTGKSFAEIAIEKEYLTPSQVNDLQQTQVPDYLLLGQALIDIGLLTNTDFERLLVDYQNENELFVVDMDTESKEKISKVISRFFDTAHIPMTDYSLLYMNLIFNNLSSYIGDDYMPLTPAPCTEYPVNYCVSQKLHNDDLNVITRLDMTEDVAITFASRYANMKFKAFDEYVQATMEDFINLHNGLFNVNLSNNYSFELAMDPPEAEHIDIVEMHAKSFIIPVIYPFGNVNIIVSFDEK